MPASTTLMQFQRVNFKCEEPEYLGDSSAASRCMLGHAVQSSTLTAMSASPPFPPAMPSRYTETVTTFVACPPIHFGASRFSFLSGVCRRSILYYRLCKIVASFLAVSTGVWHLPRRELSDARTSTDSESISTAHLDRCLQRLMHEIVGAKSKLHEKVRQDTHHQVLAG